MKQSKFTEEQVACVLSQAEAGIKGEIICLNLGLADATLYARVKAYSCFASRLAKNLQNHYVYKVEYPGSCACPIWFSG